MGRDLGAGVEEITGRRVIAFLSDNHVDPDIAIAVFVLSGPEPGGGGENDPPPPPPPAPSVT